MEASQENKKTSADKPVQRNSLNMPLIMAYLVMVVCFDQLSKYIIVKSLESHQILPVVSGFLNLTLTFNYGAAFGLWSWLDSGIREVVLGLTILLALGVVIFFLRQAQYQTRPAQVALACILGGAIGNVIDRFTRGAVVDFLDVYYKSYHWPAFNLADSAICLGVGVLLLAPSKPTSC
jgi:signal peptidase II